MDGWNTIVWGPAYFSGDTHRSFQVQSSFRGGSYIRSLLKPILQDYLWVSEASDYTYIDPA